jgi:hypothetical protein
LDDSETTPRGPAVSSCPACGRSSQWESLLDGEEERWLAVCRCGRMRAFLPEQPDLDLEDPLRAYLAGPGVPAAEPSPPWARLFLRSLEAPNPVRWRYCPGPCAGCRSSATFGMRACPRAGVLALNTLCLSCGRAAATYFSQARGMRPSPAAGSAWAPPCPAVQRLRDCVFRPHAVLAEERGGAPAHWRPAS